VGIAQILSCLRCTGCAGIQNVLVYDKLPLLVLPSPPKTHIPILHQVPPCATDPSRFQLQAPLCSARVQSRHDGKASTLHRWSVRSSGQNLLLSRRTWFRCTRVMVWGPRARRARGRGESVEIGSPLSSIFWEGSASTLLQVRETARSFPRTCPPVQRTVRRKDERLSKSVGLPVRANLSVSRGGVKRVGRVRRGTMSGHRSNHR